MYAQTDCIMHIRWNYLMAMQLQIKKLKFTQQPASTFGNLINKLIQKFIKAMWMRNIDVVNLNSINEIKLKH